MRFIRIGDHSVNVAEACYIHFGAGNRVDIVFSDRTLSGEVSDTTLFRLKNMSSDVETEEPAKGLSDANEDPSKDDWNAAWNEAIERCVIERQRWAVPTEAYTFLTSQIEFMRAKLVE